MKKTLIYIPSGLPSPELEILLSKAQSSIDKSNSTLIAVCGGGHNYACSYNIYGIKSICKLCKSNLNRGLSLLTGNYKIVESPPINFLVSYQNIINNRAKIKLLKYKSVDIGQAAYSSYLAIARDQDLEGAFSSFSLKKLLATSKILVDWFSILVKENRINFVILYNGRQNQYRPLLRIATLLKIKTLVMEFSGQTHKCVYTFNGVLPQNLDYLYTYINSTFKKFTGDIEKCSKKYYEMKKAGGKINDNKSYVTKQKKDYIPKFFDTKKHNIAIFNSSEDEFAALGGEYDKTLYKNQYDAISKICLSLSKSSDIHVWLRIHPNLYGVNWSFAKKLLMLDKKFSNVSVIKADSSISSYALLDNCNITVSFGSTMGVEAAYAGKPSILLARCIYEKLESVYVPKNHQQVINLLKNKKLKPKNKLGSYKTAVFWSFGGRKIDYFGGNRTLGFTFKKKYIRKTKYEFILYIILKTIEKVIFNSMINYYFSKIIKYFNLKKF